jgi:hypothetical protein
MSKLPTIDEMERRYRTWAEKAESAELLRAVKFNVATGIPTRKGQPLARNYGDDSGWSYE